MSLVAYYQMNTGWTDKSGNGYNGTPVGGAIINNVDQKLGSGCGEFNGLNSEITFSSFFDPSGITNFSIDGWAKANATASGFAMIFAWWNGSKAITIQLDATATKLVSILGSGNDAGTTPVIDLTSDMFYFGMVYDGTLSGNANQLKIFYNSVQQTLTFTGDIPNVCPTIATTPEMGNMPLTGLHWDGLIDDIAIYDHSLTQAEIDYRWNGGAGREISFGGNVRKKRLMELYNA